MEATPALVSDNGSGEPAPRLSAGGVTSDLTWLHCCALAKGPLVEVTGTKASNVWLSCASDPSGHETVEKENLFLCLFRFIPGGLQI